MSGPYKLIGVDTDSLFPPRVEAKLAAKFVGEGESVYHARKYGIIGGGDSTKAAANTTALNALITLAPSGSWIFFEAGTTYFTNITLPSGKVINLRGAGMGRSVVRRPAGATGDFITVSTNYTCLEDFTIEGGRYQNTGTPGMDNLVLNASYVHVARVGINKATGSGLVLGKTAPALVCYFSDLQFRENLAHHIHTVAGSDSTDNMFVNIEGGYSGKSGVKLDTGSQNMLNVHMWASGMEDAVDKHGFWINSTNNLITAPQAETNLGEGMYVTSNRNVIVGLRSWGNVKRGLFVTGTGNNFNGGLIERNNVENTAAAVSDAFAAIVVSAGTRNTFTGISTADTTTAITSKDPTANGSPAATYPYPGKPAAITMSYAVRLESGTDFNLWTGCRFPDDYTLSGSTAPYSLSNGAGNSDVFMGVDFATSAPPTQTVVTGNVRVPAVSDVILVSAGSSITAVLGHRAGRRVTLIFTNAGSGGSVTDGAGLNLAGNFSPIAGSTLSLVSDGTTWYETSRSIN
jgi:hypothetical protein